MLANRQVLVFYSWMENKDHLPVISGISIPTGVTAMSVAWANPSLSYHFFVMICGTVVTVIGLLALGSMWFLNKAPKIAITVEKSPAIRVKRLGVGNLTGNEYKGTLFNGDEVGELNFHRNQQKD